LFELSNLSGLNSSGFFHCFLSLQKIPVMKTISEQPGLKGMPLAVNGLVTFVRSNYSYWGIHSKGFVIALLEED
jgi:hypothetical protein